MRRWRLAGRLGMLMACALSVPRPAASATWTLASSEHFEVYTTAGARTARETLVQFERIRAFFAEQLQLTPPATRPVRLILFSNEREFRPYGINDATVAYYRPGPDRDYIVMQKLGPGSHAAVVHEYVHLILNRSGGRYPVWLNEGLAEYFSTLPSSGETVPVGGAPPIRVRELGEERFLPLERLFAVTQASPEYQGAAGGPSFYAQSWALTHMLLSDPRYRDGVERLLTLVRRGTPSANAVTTVYGRSLAQVMDDLAAYARARYFEVRSVHFQEPPVLVTTPAREVSPFEAGFVTANLLAAASADAGKARAAYGALARQHGDDLSLLWSRAALEIRMGQPQAAVPLLRRAVEVGSTDPELYRTLAALIKAQDGAGAEALLLRSLELDPSSVRGRLALATLVSARSPADALAVLAPVTNLNPFEAFPVMRLRVQAYLSIGDLEQAHTTARDLVALARSGLQRNAAMELLSAVDAQVAARDAPAATP